MSQYTSLGMFSGAGGLDLGFEQAGFQHVAAMDFNRWCVRTLMKNRPSWTVDEADARAWSWTEGVDALIAGPPCQGYSLGGNRQATDDRNLLYKEVIRVARVIRPRVVVIENVLNLRTLRHPESGLPFDQQIASELTGISAEGYEVFYGVFRMDGFGVPQTRRRFVFVAFRESAPAGYALPAPSGSEPIRPWIHDLGVEERLDLPNHNPRWDFKSKVHVATGEPYDPAEEPVVVRFSRTASDGYPVRDFDRPFPAVDTATVWGWAQGNVSAARFEKDRGEEAKFVRNPKATVKLWRISASRLRSMTHREMARLQTFPDDWAFEGASLRDVQVQVGNAVPVVFARRLGENVSQALQALSKGVAFPDPDPGPGGARLF
jgi:DNA (cytosine-5)-methyltransferase 1